MVQTRTTTASETQYTINSRPARSGAIRRMMAGVRLMPDPPPSGWIRLTTTSKASAKTQVPTAK